MEIKDITPGRQYMIRKHADTRRVRIEVTKVMQFDGIRTIAVFGRFIKRDKYHAGSVVVGDERAWSCYPEHVEEVEQI